MAAEGAWPAPRVASERYFTVPGAILEGESGRWGPRGASQHCPRRTANRPGSQRMARHKSTDLLQSASTDRHAADGDRPRSGGSIEMRPDHGTTGPRD